MAEEEVAVEDLDEDQKKERLDLVYEAVEIKYENYLDIFKQACGEYEIEDLFEALIDEDCLGEDEWENNAVLGEVLGEDDDGGFAEIGQEFAQFVHDILISGKCEVTSVSRPSLVFVSVCTSH